MDYKLGSLSLSLWMVVPAVCVSSHTRFLARPFYVLSPFPFFFSSSSSSSSFLSSSLGDISWIRWTACVTIDSGEGGCHCWLPPPLPPHHTEWKRGSPGRRMRRMSKMKPAGFFCMEFTGAHSVCWDVFFFNIWNGERYPRRAAADIARLPALLHTLGN